MFQCFSKTDTNINAMIKLSPHEKILGQSLPVKMDFHEIQDLSQAEERFLKGLDGIEFSFKNLLKDAEKDIQDRYKQVGDLFQKVLKNQLYLEQVHDKKLKEIRDASNRLEIQKELWQIEQEKYVSLALDPSRNLEDAKQIISLDIGGTTRMKVGLNTLCSVPGSSLEKLFGGRYKKKDSQVIWDAGDLESVEDPDQVGQMLKEVIEVEDEFDAIEADSNLDQVILR